MGKSSVERFPSCNSCCNNEPYIVAQNQYKDTISKQKKTIPEQVKQLADIKNKLELMGNTSGNNKAKLDKLAAVCMIDPQYQDLSDSDIEMLGKRIRSLLTNQYREQVDMLDAQKSILDKQTYIIGRNEYREAEQEEQLERVNSDITTRVRQMMYDGEHFHKQDRIVLGLKILATIVLVLAIIACLRTIVGKMIKNIRKGA